MHYLEGPFDSALGKIVAYLVPDHPYKSVHDFFNPHLFHSTLTAMSPFLNSDYKISQISDPNSTNSW